MMLKTKFDEMEQADNRGYAIVHPLDDKPERKVDTEHLGPMRMTKVVRVCLFALRGYLLLMFGLLAFRVLQLAGVIRG